METKQKNPKSFGPVVCGTSKRLGPEIREPDSKPKKRKKKSENFKIKSISKIECQVCILLFIKKLLLKKTFANQLFMPSWFIC